MKYKGYIGKVEYDSDAKIFHGEVIGLRAVITFQGKTTDELEQAFKDSVDDYLDWCNERGKQPEKTFSGSLSLRLPSELHAKLAEAASLKNLSLNSYIVEQLKKTK